MRPFPLSVSAGLESTSALEAVLGPRIRGCMCVPLHSWAGKRAGCYDLGYRPVVHSGLTSSEH